MNHFEYRNGVLHAEAVNLIELAQAVGTPFYCYSSATLQRHYGVFSEAFAGEEILVCYALKANSNQSVLRTLANLGAGADVVSGGELKRALAAGIPPERIRQDGRRASRRACCRHLFHQRRIRTRTRIAVAARKRAGADGANFRSGQSGRRFGLAREDFHGQVRE
jgi:diaminopimelate decarboxylase